MAAEQLERVEVQLAAFRLCLELILAHSTEGYAIEMARAALEMVAPLDYGPPDLDGYEVDAAGTYTGEQPTH